MIDAVLPIHKGGFIPEHFLRGRNHRVVSVRSCRQRACKIRLELELAQVRVIASAVDPQTVAWCNRQLGQAGRRAAPTLTSTLAG